MSVEEFVDDLKNIEIDGTSEGCFIIFCKWKQDSNLTYSQTFETKESLVLSASKIDKGVFEQQHIVVAYVNPNWNQPYFELLNTEDYYDE